MSESEYQDENCENCAYLTADDTCGNGHSVYFGRPVVYRGVDGTVDQAAWCELWKLRGED